MFSNGSETLSPSREDRWAQGCGPKAGRSGRRPGVGEATPISPLEVEPSRKSGVWKMPRARGDGGGEVRGAVFAHLPLSPAAIRWLRAGT